MLVILVDKITERLSYTLDFIFANHGVKYSLVTSIFEFEKIDGVRKFNYSNSNVDGVSHIKPSILLSLHRIIPLKIEKNKFENLECLMIEGEVDPIASVFYVLTRYEEYFNNNLDVHSRFKFESSILSKYGWIDKAMCERWSKAIIEWINPEFYLESTLSSVLNKDYVKLIPTFDIDNTYAYMHKKGFRKWMSIFKDLVYFNFNRIKERNLVLKGNCKDPYDTFEFIKNVQDEHENSKIFWLVKNNGKKDRNIPLSSKPHQRLIKSLNNVNLHPSYDSFLEKDKVRLEKENLERVTGKKITATRQHYLRMKLPETYVNLIDLGVKHEYSMGFAEHVGFRCGTARPHFWFDLNKNKLTELLIHPFVYMDGTLNEYMKLTPVESKDVIQNLFDEVKTFGGDFVFIWHNETIGEYGKWHGWRSVLEFTLKLQ